MKIVTVESGQEFLRASFSLEEETKETLGNCWKLPPWVAWPKGQWSGKPVTSGYNKSGSVTRKLYLANKREQGAPVKRVEIWSLGSVLNSKYR